MDYVKRQAKSALEEWRKRQTKKPLVVRGARQVGKTTLIKHFGAEFKQVVFLNLEKPGDSQYFVDFDNVQSIISAIFLAKNISAPYRDVLLFIDEIQEVPKAIELLRYFYEGFPTLNVIAAGSLLEFAIGDVKSFPVGRVEYLYLHPFNFQEFLTAINHKAALKALTETPISNIAHQTLLGLFHTYAIIGGMPEIVASYAKSKTIHTLTPTYESIWDTYKSDIEKYGISKTERKIIRHVIDTAATVLNKRVTFQNFGNSNYRSREVGEALRSLDAAKVIRLIYPTTDIEPPARSDIRKAPRLQYLDTGILNYELKIQAELLGMDNLSSSFKGALIPHLITQELISLQDRQDVKMNFWVREKKQSSAEVDLVFQRKGMLIPIEVKSGKTGTLRSLHQFIDRAPHIFAVRVYGGKFEVQKSKTPAGKDYILMNLPYYLGTRIPQYVNWFVSNYG